MQGARGRVRRACRPASDRCPAAPRRPQLRHRDGRGIADPATRRPAARQEGERRSAKGTTSWRGDGRAVALNFRDGRHAAGPAGPGRAGHDRRGQDCGTPRACATPIADRGNLRKTSTIKYPTAVARCPRPARNGSPMAGEVAGSVHRVQPPLPGGVREGAGEPDRSHGGRPAGRPGQ
jgi:hypothetical protein